MKTKLTTLILTALLIVFYSCGSEEPKEIDADTIEEYIENKNVEALKTAKINLTSEYSELRTQLDRINAAIEKFDTVKKIFDVTAMEVKPQVFKHFVEFQGNVNTKQNLVILAEFSGRLNRVYVKEGQRVSKGQILARIDDGGLSQQVSQLEAQAELAQTTYERQKKLWEQNIGSEIQFLQAQTNAKAAKNALNQARSQLYKTTVRAPFSGIIDEVITNQGATVAPGMQLLRIVNLNNMYVEADVPEKYISSIKKGTYAEVHFPIINHKIESEVRQVSSFINPNNRSFTIEVAVPNKDGLVKPNLTAKIRVNDYTIEKAILVPLNVISENAE
ncbi:MAG TPA: efflux RND transporter periplasmic adaptor subunit, partial [Flavobacteriaceae bacterium]|nr:efflux RND transporter periplasmic adaptor subunit [Flavobacteriaceae bacterium]